ncbi:hypothetical protein E3N88_40931 [Mikania micrantha]|uniref:PGG domain-containing protein n=1 Tax=Mikania micrantha TaxID=192012 RepID=A0A5N6LP50_9ASTR|nr:hypothetical protein E3N88_40931 [Mikania micrantha]
MERLLYEASLEGNLNTLLMLLQEDPLILDRFTLNRHGDTPLHITSMLGHTDFVNEIITRKPHLATERDSQKHVPLHIASAKGHVDIVKLLLSANPDACLARDRDGGCPIHLAAVTGCYEVVKELVQAQPDAARAMVQQDTILHLCVKHNQVEVLKLLLETMSDHEFVNTKDAHGNTILHLAVADKQVQTVNILLLTTRIDVNATNMNGETSMDILAKLPRDLRYQQIRQSLTRAGAVETYIQGSGMSQLVAKRSSPHLRQESTGKDDWLDRKRNSLMVVASLIATMAFQAGISPPSGVWQDYTTTDPLHKVGLARFTVLEASGFPVASNGYYVDRDNFYVDHIFGFYMGFNTNASIENVHASGWKYRGGMDRVDDSSGCRTHRSANRNRYEDDRSANRNRYEKDRKAGVAKKEDQLKSSSHVNHAEI